MKPKNLTSKSSQKKYILSKEGDVTGGTNYLYTSRDMKARVDSQYKYFILDPKKDIDSHELGGQNGGIVGRYKEAWVDVGSTMKKVFAIQESLYNTLKDKSNFVREDLYNIKAGVFPSLERHEKPTKDEIEISKLEMINSNVNHLSKESQQKADQLEEAINHKDDSINKAIENQNKINDDLSRILKKSKQSITEQEKQQEEQQKKQQQEEKTKSNVRINKTLN